MLSQEMLRKYITFAKQNCHPKLANADYEKIIQVWVPSCSLAAKAKHYAGQSVEGCVMLMGFFSSIIAIQCYTYSCPVSQTCEAVLMGRNTSDRVPYSMPSGMIVMSLPSNRFRSMLMLPQSHM